MPADTLHNAFPGTHTEWQGKHDTRRYGKLKTAEYAHGLHVSVINYITGK